MAKKTPIRWEDYFTADFENGVLIWKHRPISHFKDERIWKLCNTRMAGKIAGGFNTIGYYQVVLNAKNNLGHRILWEMAHGSIPDGMQIDHIDGNTRNNSISNLRIATRSQNLANQGKYANNTSGYKGVHWHNQISKWTATISVNGKPKYLGVFHTKWGAYQAYKEASVLYYGEFAHH